VLSHGGETEESRLMAELPPFQTIFHLEHGLVMLDEGPKSFALTVLKALLVERPIEVRLEPASLIRIVFQGSRQMVAVGNPAEENIESKLIGCREWEARLVLKAINVVELNGVEAFPMTHPRALRQDGTKSTNIADVEPAFTRPSSHLSADHFLGILGRVRPPTFPSSGVQVANDPAMVTV
jgi:hypothetical protein